MADNDYDPRNANAIAASEKAAARVALSPRCRVCDRPMVCGQDRSNRGAHFICAPPDQRSS